MTQTVALQNILRYKYNSTIVNKYASYSYFYVLFKGLTRISIIMQPYLFAVATRTAVPQSHCQFV